MRFPHLLQYAYFFLGKNTGTPTLLQYGQVPSSAEPNDINISKTIFTHPIATLSQFQSTKSHSAAHIMHIIAYMAPIFLLFISSLHLSLIINYSFFRKACPKHSAKPYQYVRQSATQYFYSLRQR